MTNVGPRKLPSRCNRRILIVYSIPFISKKRNNSRMNICIIVWRLSLTWKRRLVQREKEEIMDHHQQQLFSLCSVPYVFNIKKHFFVSLFSLSLLIFSTLVIFNLVGSSSFEPLLRFGLSSPSSQNSTKDCDYSKGRWVRRTSSSSLIYGEECRFLDSGFRCRKNGRKDSDYLNWRWQPHGCDLPR